MLRVDGGETEFDGVLEQAAERDEPARKIGLLEDSFDKKRFHHHLLSSHPRVVLESAQRVTDPQSEELEMIAKVRNGLSRQIQHERQAPHFVADVTRDDFHFGDIRVRDAQLEQMRVRLSVVLVRHGDVLLQLVVEPDFELVTDEQIAVIGAVQVVAMGSHSSR